MNRCPRKISEVRVFLGGVKLKLVDDLIGAYGNTRSEVVRNLIQSWIDNNIDKLGKNVLQLAEEAENEGYTSPEEGE